VLSLQSAKRHYMQCTKQAELATGDRKKKVLSLLAALSTIFRKLLI
jgi:hypothetical protein